LDVVETNAKDDRRPGETLRAAGVSRSFQGVQALAGVDLELHDHEVVGLIGPNGAGKSTLVNLLTGFDRADEGSVELSGRDVTRWSPDRRGRAGLTRTFQHSHAFRGLSVRENIWLAASRIHSGDKARAAVDEMLERVGLTDAAERLVGQLAHGQRQWVELGLVLATDPELILLDEPAAGMTHEEVNKTAELVREINRTKALIVVEHDMQFIRMIAKQVTVFNQGSVLVEDSVENIMRNPQVRDIYLGKQAAA